MSNDATAEAGSSNKRRKLFEPSTSTSSPISASKVLNKMIVAPRRSARNSDVDQKMEIDQDQDGSELSEEDEIKEEELDPTSSQKSVKTSNLKTSPPKKGKAKASPSKATASDPFAISPRKPVPKKTFKLELEGSEIKPAPKNWEKQYETIKALRKRIVAPVDVMGCEMAGERSGQLPGKKEEQEERDQEPVKDKGKAKSKAKGKGKQAEIQTEPSEEDQNKLDSLISNIDSNPVSSSTTSDPFSSSSFSSFQGSASSSSPEQLAKNRRFAILVSLMLSSQTKDQVTSEAVNNLQKVLPGGLTVRSVIDATDDEISNAINKVGFWRRKTGYVKSVARILEDNEGGDGEFNKAGTFEKG